MHLHLAFSSTTSEELGNRADPAAGQPIASSAIAHCISSVHQNSVVRQRGGEHVLFRSDAPASFIKCFLSEVLLLVRYYILRLFAFSAPSYIAVNLEKSPQSVKEIGHVSFFHHLCITIVLLT